MTRRRSPRHGTCRWTSPTTCCSRPTSSGRLTYVNATAARVLHYDEAELVGRVGAGARPRGRPRRRARVLCAAARARPDRHLLRAAGRRRGPRPRCGWACTCEVVRGDGQTPRLVRGAARDISDRRRVEDALHQSDERYRQAFDENLAGIYVVSPSGPDPHLQPGLRPDLRLPVRSSTRSARTSGRSTRTATFAVAHRPAAPGRRGAAARDARVRRVDGRTLHDHREPGRALRRSRRAGVGQRLRLRRQPAEGPRGADAPGAEDGGARPPGRRRRARLQQHPDGHQRAAARRVLSTLEPGSLVREDLEEILAAGRRAAGLTAQLLAFSRKRVLLPTTFDLQEVVTTMQPMLKRLLGVGHRAGRRRARPSRSGSSPTAARSSRCC